MNFAFNQGSLRPNKGPAVANSVSEPKIIGYYSVDGDRNYLPGSSAMQYYNPPKLGEVYMDLNQGIESAIRKSSAESTESGRISHLLEWIKLNSDKILATKKNKWIEPEFVCSCGVLSLVMCTPFKPKDDWIICVAKWKGTIYLCRIKEPEDACYREQDKYTSWGFKFEQYIVSDHPDKAPNTSRPVVEPAEFRCILKRSFGRHSVLFSAEMDAVRSKTILNDPLPLAKLKFVELKTKKEIKHEGQMKNFKKFNLVQWWTQSFVAGIDDILCGFRDDEGIVRKLTSYSLDQIVESSRSYWDPQDCIKYCEHFLNLVSETVVEECNVIIYKFEKIAFKRIVTTELSPTSDYAFIPKSFLEKTG